MNAAERESKMSSEVWPSDLQNKGCPWPHHHSISVARNGGQTPGPRVTEEWMGGEGGRTDTVTVA